MGATDGSLTVALAFNRAVTSFGAADAFAVLGAEGEEDKSMVEVQPSSAEDGPSNKPLILDKQQPPSSSSGSLDGYTPVRESPFTPAASGTGTKPGSENRAVALMTGPRRLPLLSSLTPLQRPTCAHQAARRGFCPPEVRSQEKAGFAPERERLARACPRAPSES